MERVVVRKKNGKVYTNYRCRTYAQMLKSACTKRTISEDDIAAAVLAVIQKYIEVLIDFEEVLKNADYQKHRRSQSYAVEKRLTQKQRELDDIERIKLGMYTDLKKNIITQDDYVSPKASYAEQAVTLSQQIGSLKDELKNLEKQDTMQNEWLERFRKHRNIEKLKMVYHTYFHSAMVFGIIFWGNLIGSNRVFLQQKRIVITILGINH
jgi:hypothetical protein